MMPSERWKRIDDLIDDLLQALGIATLALLALLVGFVVAVRVVGGAG